MNRQAYSQTYSRSKQTLREAVKRFQQENPQRFNELQEQALREIEHPPERPITRHLKPPLLGSFDVDEFIRSVHTQDYIISTTDMFGGSHTYFETLHGETAEAVLARRHPRFTERNEKITRIKECRCPLCMRTPEHA